jgi:pyruvate dehydrogenase E2 component (dihydrolipoamide acetyltransferase)
MPKASPTMEMGVLVAWRVKEGEPFPSSTVMAEVGTDKANMEIEIFDPGVMIKHLVDEGAEIPPGYPIAIIGQREDEDISQLLVDFEAAKQELESGAETEVEAIIDPAPTPSAPVARTTPTTPPKKREWMGQKLSTLFLDPPGDIQAAKTERRVAASPLAKAVAKELGVNLKVIQGTGISGRIVAEDVERAAKSGGARGGAGPVPADQVLKNTPMRKTIAKRLLQSHQDIPTFFLTSEFDMQGFVDLRKALKTGTPDLKLSYNDLMIKAVALALRETPAVNATWADNAITRHGRCDIGVAVALPDGLITPMIRNADQLSIFEIAAEVRHLAGKAKDGKLQPDEYTNGTLTISNLGMFGIDQFTAIINPPEAAILAVGGIRETAVSVNGQLASGWRMSVTMTCDHRVIDGAVGATFLKSLRKFVETPYLLLV